MNVLITGANRGIGLEFCRQLTGRGDQVMAACRSCSSALQELKEEAGDRLQLIEGADVTSDEGLDSLFKSVEGAPIDLLINNAGLMEGVTLDHLDTPSIRRQFEINAIAPLRVTQGLLDNLSKQARVCIVTSRMGSIDDNDSGGSYGYRMSKAAANMVGRSLSVDLASRGVSVALLHPGYVRTDMTGGNGLMDTNESVRGLIGIIDRLGPENTGLFWHTNGEVLPW
ncbi:MAG: SDR family oxidoreductase [Hyphomicrobiaceae bacterium]|nr:SDR family oxidoreductase [Hyphomicrobiaceae bacterium]